MSSHVSAALARTLPLLTCPVCGGGLTPKDAQPSVACARGHSFDIAKQGYLSLLAGGKGAVHGDTADMIAARARFLDAGHYAPIADAVAAYLPAGVIADIGGGTGYYSSFVLGRLPDAEGLLVDVSVPALRRAAKAHPRLAAIGADVRGTLPLAPGTCDATMTIFAPRNPAELHRVLKPAGRCVFVIPQPAHLRQLRAIVPGALGIEARKDETLLAQCDPFFSLVASKDVTYDVDCSDAQVVRDALFMGPTGHHTTIDDIAEDVAGVSHFTVSVSVYAFEARYLPSADR